MLRSVGVPVPEGRAARTADDAWAAALDVGLPVVVKPEAGNQGKGVSVSLYTEAQVRRAYDLAAAFDTSVLVERHVVGDDYRLLIVNGRMVAAARREPAQVVGDGVRPVEQLVAEVNRDPARRPGHSKLGKVREFTAKGLTAYMYTGAMQTPPPTITGSIVDDLILIPEVIGLGELAISDVRSTEPSLAELARWVSQALRGGNTGGKPDVTRFHVGPGHRRSGAVCVIDGRTISYTSLSEKNPEGTLSIFDTKLHLLAERDGFDLTTGRPIVPEEALVESSATAARRNADGAS